MDFCEFIDRVTTRASSDAYTCANAYVDAFDFTRVYLNTYPNDTQEHKMNAYMHTYARACNAIHDQRYKTVPVPDFVDVCAHAFSKYNEESDENNNNSNQMSTLIRLYNDEPQQWVPRLRAILTHCLTPYEVSHPRR